MVRTKKSQPRAEEPAPRASPRKRGRDEPEEPTEGTPSRRRSSGRTGAGAGSRTNGRANGSRSEYDFPSDEEVHASNSAMEDTGTPRKRKRQPATATATPRKDDAEAATPRGREGKGNVTVTPSKPNGTAVNGETPRWKRNDRSARKKSARALIEKVVAGESSDEEADEDIAREIYESSEEEEAEDGDDEEQQQHQEEGEEGPLNEAATPSKKPRGGRTKTTNKKTTRRKKSPTPPRDLPPHEQYFAQNRPGTSQKTSNNTLASLQLQLLTHDEYFAVLRDWADPHADDVAFLQAIHGESFPQWAFELAQGFGICLYGYGSKRALLHRFARHIYDLHTAAAAAADHCDGYGNGGNGGNTMKVVIVNGYVRTASLREILGTVASAVDPGYKLPAGGPSAVLDSVKNLLSSHEVMITVVLNSIDAAPLRKPGIQPILAQLAAHPQIQLICSADTPDFTLLWDSSLRSSFNFLFHDCTTFAPYEAELDVVDDVHELLGRKARRVGGKEGVTYVLRSLPENAKNLFRLLVGEVLVLMDDDGGSSGENPGVEYRAMYQKAEQEFICSSEMAFRTLLKEFHDHQMITSRRDVMGTELLSVPFRKEELEAILEDLMS
ncbi:Uu.00g087250.m01.CDS01 [Anthostomella pinea]|uniref:Origin recognition complex subunit 2 n=1 Tax=Anthostomella pinea TaxID=933095 RepID=A0AAI8VMA7_9PEZI|nr:Uu.00g087250.m01.CDS01 [Anthostomella pinea]